jgi:homoserine kinase
LSGPHRTPLRACAVRVPCSTSNLGAGFDCLGLAFDRYLDAGFTPDEDAPDAAGEGAPGSRDGAPGSSEGTRGSREGTPRSGEPALRSGEPAPRSGEPALRSGEPALRVRRAGTLAALDLPPEQDLIATAFRAELRRRGVGAVSGEIIVTSGIPVGRGLGSSAAAVVAGIALATAATRAQLDRDSALASAAAAEGHPDNAGPSIYGGLVAIAYIGHTPRALRLPLSPDLSFVFAAPDATVSTQRARAALPGQVPHSAAVRNTGRMAALLYGLAEADRDALAAGFNDELHVPYRLPLIPGAREAMAAAAAAGAWAVTISGSGSGLLAVCGRGGEQAVLNALRRSFSGGGHGGGGFVVCADTHGVQPRDVVTLLASLRGGNS